ncbi:MAG: cell wall-binding repeat-containing protein [Actinobacteria bacterium]|nr:cell wall-binding repeat-containing protein [Actinomycetota bacterium]
MTSTTVPAQRSLPERIVDRAATWLAGEGLSRRRFLGRAAVVGSALAVEPWGYVLRPGTAYASVCGESASCNGGWTAFCCTINDGANTCPPGSFVAGWWKIDDSPFCNGDARYIIDCNRTPGASCRCTCADGECDKRRVCCNVFRYGQCNQHIRGVTEVVCRVVLCTPPWEWDENCTTTVRTDNRTRTHNATCLPGADPSAIAVRYQDLGLTGSVLGRQTTEERTVDGGRLATYQHGLMLSTATLGAHYVLAGTAEHYEELGREESVLGFPTADQHALPPGIPGSVAEFQRGAIWASSTTGVHETHGGIHGRYLEEGGAAGWMGLPVTGVQTVLDGRQRSDFASEWSIAYRPSDGSSRLLPADEPLPLDGSWPPRPAFDRIDGPERIATAIAISRTVHPRGAGIAFLARSDGFADALTGGVAAALRSGPVLLTPPDRLVRATADELRRLGVRRIVLLGGPVALSAAVAEAAGQVAPVERWAGEHRAGTAVEISRRGVAPDGSETVFVTGGGAFAFALAAAPVAAARRAPVLLVGGTVPPETREEIARLTPDEIVVVGGPGVVSDAVYGQLRGYAPRIRRVGSDDRYVTSAALADEIAVRGGAVVVATGQDFPDGLAAGPLAVSHEAPIVLVRRDDITPAVHDLLRQQGFGRVTLVGGEAAVDGSVERRLRSYPVEDAVVRSPGT